MSSSLRTDPTEVNNRTKATVGSHEARIIKYLKKCHKSVENIPKLNINTLNKAGQSTIKQTVHNADHTCKNKNEILPVLQTICSLSQP